MKNLIRFTYILFIVSCIFLVINCAEEDYFENVLDSEDINPHSFFYDKHNKKMMKEIEKNINMEDSSEKIMRENVDRKQCNCVKEVDNCENHEIIFYKRLINLLLANIHIKEEDDMLLTGLLEIEISHAQMKILQDFQSQKISLRKLDEILSHVIKKPQYNISNAMHFLDLLISKFEKTLRIIQEHSYGAMVLFLMLISGLILRMFKQGRRFSLFVGIQIIIVLSFFMTWWQLVQEAELKAFTQQMKFSNVPIACQPDKMSMWDKFVSFVTSNDDCEKYYEAMMSNPKLKVTPAHALSHLVTSIILHPAANIGTAISHFVNNATGDLPSLYAWSIKIMLFAALVIVIVLIPICISGVSLNFGLGPLGLLKFGIGNKKTDRKGNSLEYETKREPVQIVLQVQHGASVPTTVDASVLKQLNQIEMTKTSVEENDTKKADTDLSCGDTIQSIEFLKHDKKEFQQKENVVENGSKCNDGSGDA